VYICKFPLLLFPSDLSAVIYFFLRNFSKLLKDCNDSEVHVNEPRPTRKASRRERDDQELENQWNRKNDLGNRDVWGRIHDSGRRVVTVETKGRQQW
jgi:hypothetical protein